ncbi:MAG: carbamate kinase, partial [Myxococcales bacterium]|nr:carbamate kinase [Myxococcales bacterium]
ACGGGGIPVERDAEQGHLQGLEAVIDKDRTSALLANGLGAERLVITTGVDAVYLDFRTAPKRVARLTAAEAAAHLAAGQFPAGSMGPKIEAALWFLERGGREVIICHPDDLLAACEGRAGTLLTKEATP